jgi:5-methylcytosine-specific restriction endonuclease McrA
MKKNNFSTINNVALSRINSTKAKTDNEKQKKELKRDILNLSNDLFKEKRINKSAYEKMFDLVLSQSRMNALEDAHNALIKIKNSEDLKVYKKDFTKLKKEEKVKREGEDKFITMINKNKEKKLHKYHLSVKIHRKITYTSKKSGKKSTYLEPDHVRQLVGYDNLNDSRIVEASSLEEARQIYSNLINEEQTYEEYSSNALVDVDKVDFIDDSPVVSSQIQSSNPRNMPLRQAGYIEYNFTNQETKYLTNENTCVIDNLVGLYGKELKLNKQKLIKINKEFHGIVENVNSEPEFIKSDLDDLIINPKFNRINKLPELEKQLYHYKLQNKKTEFQIDFNDFNSLKFDDITAINNFCKDYNISIEDFNDYKDKATPKFKEHVHYKKSFGMEIKFSDDATPEYKDMIYKKHGVESTEEKIISYEQINKIVHYVGIKDLKTNVKYIKTIDDFCTENNMTKEDFNTLSSNMTNDIYFDDEIERLEEIINDNDYDISNAFTPAFIEYFCQRFGISHYAFDINKTCFMKYVHKNQNQRCLCYYAMNNHMYLVKDKDQVKSMVEKAKEPEHKHITSLLEHDKVVNHDYNDKEIYINETMENVKANLKTRSNCIYMYSRYTHNINDIFEDFITMFNVFPIIKKCKKTNIMEFHYQPKEKNLIIFCCDPNDIDTITYKEVKALCEQHKVEWKNQTYTSFITELKSNFYDELNGRIKFSNDQKEKICKAFKYACNICKCCIKTEAYEIDHIRALSNGGTNETNNLQPLCKACHLVKTSNEHEQGQYIKIKDTESTFNQNVQEIMDSPLTQTHAFVEKVYSKQVAEDEIIYSIDINKCRKNILYYGDYDYCVFTVFDKVEKFKGTTIRPGLYYVESQNYMPLRCNGWYYHNMVVYCLQNDIIKLEDIKFVIKSSLTLKKDYYNKFIDYCYSNIKDYDKLAINSMIGNFKPNKTKNEHWFSGVFTSDSTEAFNSYLINDSCFIDVKTINDVRYYHTFNKSYSTNLETESPIYNQILQQEQIELHKLSLLIKSNGGTILDYNTDAINCIFKDNKFPFELVQEIQLNNYYWDKQNKVYKYKIEYGKERLKVSRMEETMRTDTFNDFKHYNWRLQNDVDDNNFEPLVNKIMGSKESWFITGPGGSGKTTLIKDLQQKMKEQELKYMSLCPTNLAALLVNGMTIHKFSARLKKTSNIKKLDLNYIFIDEVSMMQEMFYKFLIMIKKIKPEIKYIISGDYNQLKPVNDRISQYTDYGNSPCLFELADFNKIQLTKCRRANDKLYNLIQFKNIPNLKPSDFNETKEYTQ